MAAWPRKPGALHRPRPDQGGRDHRGEPVAQRLAHRQVDQGQLQLGALPGQVVEPGAGHLRPALDVDRAEQRAELEMVAWGEPLGGEVARRAVGLQDHVVVLAARRDVGEDQVAHLAEHRVEGVGDLVLGRVGLLHQVGELLGPLEQAHPLLTLRAGQLLAETPSARPAAPRTGRSRYAGRDRPPPGRRPATPMPREPAGMRVRGRDRCAAPWRRSPAKPSERLVAGRRD